MDGQTYWETIGFQKDFEDPFPIEKLKTFLPQDALVVEYGCGYGRVLKQMQEAGYTNLLGFDYSSKMVERGKKLCPTLDIRHIPKSGHIPLSDQKADFPHCFDYFMLPAGQRSPCKPIPRVSPRAKKGRNPLPL